MAVPKLCTTKLLNQSFGTCITPEDCIMPFFNTYGTNYYRPWRLSTEAMEKDFGSAIDNTKERFTVTLDVQHFKPNEINVKVTNYELRIEGKHEERLDEHGFISRQFTRRYVLPENCLTETMTSTLSSDGVLMITANKRVAKEFNTTEKVVPIIMCGACPRKEEKLFSATSNGTKTISSEMETMKMDSVAESMKTMTDTETMKVIAETGTKIAESEKSDKKDAQVTLKEDHSRLLKYELLKEAASTTEKLLTESKKETDELLKLISANKAPPANCASDKLEDVIGQCKTAIAELKEKISDTAVSSTTEMANIKSSMTSEFQECMESSSFQSSMSSTTSSLKATSETTNELLICAELKAVAEN